ncbi:MAG: hypothetical protein WC551_10265 [Patescibacteria group bacterium]
MTTNKAVSISEDGSGFVDAIQAWYEECCHTVELLPKVFWIPSFLDMMNRGLDSVLNLTITPEDHERIRQEHCIMEAAARRQEKQPILQAAIRLNEVYHKIRESNK